jgi:hypothetical protein
VSCYVSEEGFADLIVTFEAVEVIRNNMAARQNDLRLYLDIIPDPAKVYIVMNCTQEV